MEFVEILTIIGSFAAIISGIYYGLKILDRRPKVRVGKFPEPHTDPPLWKIRIRYSNKPLEECQVLFNGKSLLWDISKKEFYTIEVNDMKNLTIPMEILDKHGEVIVKSNDRTIKTIRFDKITEELA